MIKKKKFFYFIFFVVICGLFFSKALYAQIAEQMDIVDTKEAKGIALMKGEIATLKVYDLTRISLTDPSVADIIEAKGDKILLIAREVGQTVLFLWDKYGKKTFVVYVFNQNLEEIQNRLMSLFQVAEIEGIQLSINNKEGKIVLSGGVPEDKQDLFNKIIEPFSPDIIVLTEKEKRDDLVQIDMQVTELSTTLSQTLGIDWTNPLKYNETLPSFDGSVKDYFKIGDFNRTTALLATVNALLVEGKARILSQPKLVVVSGEEANFLVGGEIPVKTSTVNETGTAENVNYKSYGIGMTIKPIIRKKKIDITLSTEISDVDASNSSEDNVAFVTRTAQTQLFLEDGQTIVLAGLIRSTKSQEVKQVPFLGKIPVVGLLFRSKSTPAANQDNEIVISLTPYILMNKKDDLVLENMENMRIQEKAVNNIAQEKEEPKMLDIQDSVDEKTLEQSQKVETLAEKSPLIKKTVKEMPVIDEKPLSVNSSEYLFGIPEELQEYVKDVQKRIAQAISYPQEAQSYGWQGVVKIGMLILNDGTLAFALVKESSGYEVFDNNALKVAKSLAPYPRFPANTDLMELSITVPIVYSLTKQK